MPKVNFGDVDDAQDFSPAPAGKYPMVVDSIEVRESSGGDEQWALTLLIADGEFEGRKVWDNLTFSPKGVNRVKIAYKAAGYETDHERNCKPKDLEGKAMLVDVVVESYVANDGTEKKRNKVTYAGYHALEGKVAAKAAANRDMPF